MIPQQEDPCDSYAESDGIRVRCTVCGFVGTFDDFDVLGADPNRLFCGQCGREAPVEESSEDELQPNDAPTRGKRR
jgi:hypothetical protein